MARLLALIAGLISWTAAAAPATGPPAAATPSRDSVRLERAWPVMGTLFRAVVQAPDSATAVPALLAARDEMLRLDSLLSDYRDDSEVSRLALEAGSGRWTALSPETAALLRASLRWAEDTGGAFDPTVGPLVRAWGFRGPSPHVPSAARRDSALALVGWGMVETRAGGREARLSRRGMALDFGAIGKGYALDRAAAVVRRRGGVAGMLDLGGNIRLFGGGPGPNGGWPIGIRNPRCPEETLGSVRLDSGSVATSADYERYFEEAGVRYGHILDPRTGWPAEGVAQVTVVARDGLTADVLSTALFVMGPKRGQRLLQEAPGARGKKALWVLAGTAAPGSAESAALARDSVGGGADRAAGAFVVGGDGAATFELADPRAGAPCPGSGLSGAARPSG